MRGIETVLRYELNERIEKLPWELKKQRIVYELMKEGMTDFEIQGELEGMVSKREVMSTLVKLRTFLKRGEYEPRTRRELQRHLEKRVGQKSPIRDGEDCEMSSFSRSQSYL